MCPKLTVLLEFLHFAVILHSLTSCLPSSSVNFESSYVQDTLRSPAETLMVELLLWRSGTQFFCKSPLRSTGAHVKVQNHRYSFPGRLSQTQWEWDLGKCIFREFLKLTESSCLADQRISTHNGD